jgi:alkanesulfonate monooxygenase SsuD/methylene tetrahydromethanopterin reductase-like flavin-dependent oxidoreductase (luciferase family)
MKFSLMTEPQIGGTYDQLLAAALWAERRGLVSFARSDHFYSSRTPVPEATEALATLAGLARETTSIRLCVLVTPITFRHPAVIAKTAATIDQMSHGRFDLGVGTGWMELEHQVFGLPFPDWDERFDRLEETLEYLEVAAGAGPARHDGTHYSISATALPRPGGMRLVIGGSGPLRTPTLAGRKADEYNHFIDRPEVIAPKIEVMRRAAESAGRDPSSVEVTVMGPVLAGRDEEEYERRLHHAAEARNEDPTAFEARWRDAGIPMGGPDRLAVAFQALTEIGVGRYYLQWLDLDDLAGLERSWEAIEPVR